MRPVVYVFYVYKFRAISARVASRKAIKISLIIDLIQFAFSNIRIVMSNKAIEALNLEQGKPGKSQVDQSLILSGQEQQALRTRTYLNFFKYLVREPIFTSYTKPAIQRALGMIWAPEIIQKLILMYINYYRYYSYIA